MRGFTKEERLGHVARAIESSLAFTGAGVSHQATRDELKSLSRLAVTAAERNATLERAQAAMDQFVSEFPRPSDAATEWYSPFPGKAEVGLAVGFSTIDCVYFNVRSPRPEHIKRALSILSAHGFKRTKDAPEDYPEMQRRGWKYEGEFRFQAFFDGVDADGSVCEFKQTGVKEEPVYELVCAGEVLG